MNLIVGISARPMGLSFVTDWSARDCHVDLAVLITQMLTAGSGEKLSSEDGCQGSLVLI